MLLKIKIHMIALMLLTSILIVPSSLSYAQTDNNATSIPAVPTPDQTGVNQTSVDTTGDKDAQQISDFVTKAGVDFQQQKTETRQVMLDCRDKLQTAAPGDLDKIRSDCKIQLDTIKQKYQDERKQFHDLMQKYRESVMTFTKQAKGLHVTKVEMDNALNNVKSKMRSMMSSGNMPGHVGQGFMATKNNTHCVNPPGGPAIC